jgi:arginyl-tRNA synthetase
MIEQEISGFIDDTLSADAVFGAHYSKELLILENPKDPEHGDIAANIAFRLAKPMRKSPAELAKGISNALNEKLAAHPLRGEIDAIEPLNGFVNIRLSAKALRSVLGRIAADKEKYGN